MEQTVNADSNDHQYTNTPCKQWRNWLGFWLLGLCNNFAYVVMLSAAQDILQKQQSGNTTKWTVSLLDSEGVKSGNNSRYDCSPVSTAAVLLADILPTLIIKLSVPLLIHQVPYGVRVLFCVVMAATSFLIVSFSSTVWMSIIGVIFASASSGVGELSFLSLTVYYSRDVLGAWGSGTGGAGVAGALLYSSLTQVGLSPRSTLLTMLTVPLAMFLSYFLLLAPPPHLPQWKDRRADGALFPEERQRLMDQSQEEQETCRQEGRNRHVPLTLHEKLHIIKDLMPFICPLVLVYYAEYFINQGLMELLYFPKFFLSHAEQYRCCNICVQVPDFVPGGRVCVSLLLVLCEDQETLGPCSTPGGECGAAPTSSVLPLPAQCLAAVPHHVVRGSAGRKCLRQHLLLHQQGDGRQTARVCYGSCQPGRQSGHRVGRTDRLSCARILL
ncbi:battenin isoform X1 [Entelurus aequoreus]|uniref:battenin isoform X1 n=1 Tax=Entelurus aequoreus TaxID=161455 RepID=UPI002B1D2756|nr:battenin isoform X1 [Entelurus aequoreus]